MPCFYQELKSPNPVLPLGFLTGASLVEGLSPSGSECFLMKESVEDIQVNKVCVIDSLVIM